MHVSRSENVIEKYQTKSFTSIYELFRSSPFRNLANKSVRKDKKKVSVKTTPGVDFSGKAPDNDSSESNYMAYVTSEKYHNLNRSSIKSILHSSSTLFYDLDSIAVRHSFTDLSIVSYSNCLSHFKLSTNLSPNGFKGESHAIVQECATQIQPTLIRPRDSLAVAGKTKKVTKCFPNDPDFSSEIFLRDEDVTNYVKKKFSDKHVKRNLKYWSYAKYHTQYTNPSHQEKKSKKKEKENVRQIEDPCPCQLFSYTCPCTENKSLTGLKNSKSLNDQITSTSNIAPGSNIMREDRKEHKNTKGHKGKKNIIKDDKPTSITCFADELGSFEKSDQPSSFSEKYVISQSLDTNIGTLDSKCKSQSQYKRKRKILCPNCKEKIEISNLDLLEGEGSNKYSDSLYQMQDYTGKSIYTYKTSVKKQLHVKPEIKDGCIHKPRCDLVPVCQILPTDNVFLNYKSVKKSEKTKGAPRVIRITKACRHHPPCTVAPSCQRANILKNNCEFIPPCLHRPRCVNLPLCVPFTKNIDYGELTKHIDDVENEECPHIPRCKYIPQCLQDINGNLNNQINIAQLQNTCTALNGFQPLHINPPSIQKSFSPCQIHPPGHVTNFKCSISDKSCQYENLNIPCSPNVQECVSSEAVVFIRDVGCQFKNKYNTPKESLRSTKSSSILFDYNNINLGNVYTNVHTLRYEDKFTNPKGKIDIDTSFLSLTSTCMSSSSHRRYREGYRPSGFEPVSAISPCVAYATAFRFNRKKNNAQLSNLSYYSTPVKSRLSASKNKYRKMFALKRKRKKRGGSQMFFQRKSFS